MSDQQAQNPDEINLQKSKSNSSQNSSDVDENLDKIINDKLATNKAEQAKIDQKTFDQSQENKKLNEEIKDEKELKPCNNCQKQFEKILLCGGCKKIGYCSPDCQKQDWKEHQKNCDYFKQKQIENLPVYKQIEWFEMVSKIGHGNFSEIYKVKDKKTNLNYALKQIDRRRLKQVNKEKDIDMEKYKLTGSPYVIEFIDSFFDELNMYVQMELVEGGELWYRIRSFGCTSNHLIRYYTMHLINAMEYIHSKGIIHRDLKAENVMVTYEHQLKLIDFGTARDMQNPDVQGSGQGGKGKKNYQHFVGTPNFMGPEQAKNLGSGYETDIWQLGGLIFQIATGFPPYLGASEYLVFKQVLEEDPVFRDELFDDQLKDLILQMMRKDMQDRIKLEDLKRHEFFKDWEFSNIPKYEECKQMMSPGENVLMDIQKQFYKSIQDLDEKQNKYDQFFIKGQEQIESIKQTLNSQEQEKIQKRFDLMRKQGISLANLGEFSWK